MKPAPHVHVKIFPIIYSYTSIILDAQSYAHIIGMIMRNGTICLKLFVIYGLTKILKM